MPLGNKLLKNLKIKVSFNEGSGVIPREGVISEKTRCYIKRNGRDIVPVYTDIDNSLQQFNVFFLTILKVVNGSYIYYYLGVILMWEGSSVGEGGMNRNNVICRSGND